MVLCHTLHAPKRKLTWVAEHRIDVSNAKPYHLNLCAGGHSNNVVYSLCGKAITAIEYDSDICVTGHVASKYVIGHVTIPSKAGMVATGRYSAARRESDRWKEVRRNHSAD